MTPYESQPKKAFWKNGVTRVKGPEFKEIYTPRFDIPKDAKIAAAGSCFAQHIGKQFKARGYNFMDAEPPPPMLPAELHQKYGYSMYSARYGNVYSIQQMLQLLMRAAPTTKKNRTATENHVSQGRLDRLKKRFGRISTPKTTPKKSKFKPKEPFWEKEGRWFDPFRPNIMPAGYESKEEAQADRDFHLKSVRRLIRNADVFVFTFGLTEAWVSKEDGAVLPTCPGTIAGEFNPQKYEFKNFNYIETFEAACEFIERARSMNPNLKFLFTVSPVPLTATATDQHVLPATVYSKSTLRAVCGDLYQKYDFVDYFPSFELVASHPMKAAAFAPNLRSVLPEGVERVMSHFFGFDTPIEPNPTASTDAERPSQDDVVCEEAILESFSK